MAASGREKTPHDLEMIADLGKIAHLLAGRRYKHEDIERIMYRNFVDFFRRRVPSRSPATKLLPDIPKQLARYSDSRLPWSQCGETLSQALD